MVVEAVDHCYKLGEYEMSLRVIIFLFTLLAAPVSFGAAFFQAGASCAPVNNSVSSQTKINY